MGQVLSPAALSSLGLLLDIAGVVLLFFFGLPADVHQGGGTAVLWGGGPENAKRYRRARALSRLGLALLVAGFGLQIAGNYLDTRAPAALPAPPCSEAAS